MKRGIKFLSIFFAVFAILSTFSILTFAADKDITQAANKAEYKVEFVSSLDEKEKTVYLEGNRIFIYKVPADAVISSDLINKKYMCGTITTNKDGRAQLNVEPGTYIVKEDNFTYNGSEYEAEFLTFTVSDTTPSFTVYFKHSKVVKPEEPIWAPFTGQSMTTTIAAATALIFGTTGVIILAKKKKDEEI